jgi:hypothetical protein
MGNELVTAGMVYTELCRVAEARAGNQVHEVDLGLDSPPNHFHCGLCRRAQDLAEGASAPVTQLCRDCAGAELYLPGIELVAGRATIEQMNELVGFLLTQEGDGLVQLDLAMVGGRVFGTIGGIYFMIWPNGQVRLLAVNEKFSVGHFWNGYLQVA